jgi:hypothetical protein
LQGLRAALERRETSTQEIIICLHSPAATQFAPKPDFWCLASTLPGFAGSCLGTGRENCTANVTISPFFTTVFPPFLVFFYLIFVYRKCITTQSQAALELISLQGPQLHSFHVPWSPESPKMRFPSSSLDFCSLNHGLVYSRCCYPHWIGLSVT